MPQRVIVLLVLLLVSAGLVARADRTEVTPLRSDFSLFPLQLASWRGTPAPPLTPEVLKVLGADDYLTRSYATAQTSSVGLFIGYWKSQRQGDTIHSPMNCLPGAGWEPVAQSIAPLPAGGPEAHVNRVIIQKGLDRQLVYYWYQSHGRVIASEYAGRFYLVADAIRLNRTDGAIVRVITPIDSRSADAGAAEQAAERSLHQFITDLRPQLNAFLPN